MIQAIIVDDEPLARDVIRMHLAHCSGWELVAECSNAMDAYEALINHSIQVIFLDIQMPRIRGIDFLRTLKDPPKIIFTTAYAEFALEGFELNAVDYLLKPVTQERFQQAITKAEQQLNYKREAPKEEPAAVSTPADDFIFIRQDSRLVKVSFTDILYLEARRDFTQIYLKDKKMLAGFHLKMLEDMLPASQFMRVHRSYIVRLGAIEALNGNTIEIKGFQVPVSSINRATLARVLKI